MSCIYYCHICRLTEYHEKITVSDGTTALKRSCACRARPGKLRLIITTTTTPTNRWIVGKKVNHKFTTLICTNAIICDNDLSKCAVWDR